MRSVPRALPGAGAAFPSDGRCETTTGSVAGNHRVDAVPDLRTLFARHYASVWRLLRRFGVPAAELDDQAQEVFWVTARRLADLEPGREMAFLYGVALRVASNAVRRERAAPPHAPSDTELMDPQPSPEERLDQLQSRQLLDRVLGAMPLELRVAFVLFELEGLSVSEIAALEGLPVGTASSRLRRAREEFSAISKRLRVALAAQGATRR